jgi:ankyrin repeat protein
VVADDQTRVAYLLEKKHASVTAIDLQGETPLHHAVLMASPAMVQFLIAHGADVNQRDRDGWTPIMTAAYLDKAEHGKSFVDHSADVNGQSSAERTTLRGDPPDVGEILAIVLPDIGSTTERFTTQGRMSCLDLQPFRLSPFSADARVALRVVAQP